MLTKNISTLRKLPSLTIHETPWPWDVTATAGTEAPWQPAAPVTDVSPLAPHTPTPVRPGFLTGLTPGFPWQSLRCFVP